MFSQTAEYALRVIIFLGTLRGVPATIKQIAAATRVPQGYLAKILQSLSRAQLVQSQRGLHGGSVLARDPAEMTVYDVIEAVSQISRIRTCPLGLASHGTMLCPLHRELDRAMELVENAFRQSSIAALLGDRTTSIPLQSLPDNPGAATRAAEAAFPVAKVVTLRLPRRTGTKKRG